jgi:hypothetical protein
MLQSISIQLIYFIATTMYIKSLIASIVYKTVHSTKGQSHEKVCEFLMVVLASTKVRLLFLKF